MTITIISIIRIKEGKMEEDIEVLKESVSKIKEAKSCCLEYISHTVKRRKNKNTIVFYEKYEKDAALKLQTDNLGKSIEKLTPLLEPVMEFEICFEII